MPRRLRILYKFLFAHKKKGLNFGMYDFKKIEKKWSDYWIENKIFKTNIRDFSKPKYYALDMFPYPSGVGLHAGHVEGYTATDIVARMKRMQGYNVLHPIGYDSFGLPAEQFAIKTGKHPSGFTDENIANFRKQLIRMGFSFDWDREISSHEPSYYKWTQWIFEKLYEDGLAKYIDMPVNWCEGLGTVLSNDEIIDGKSERGGYPVVRKNMKQWVIDMPKYAEKLLNGLENIDWPESTKEIQRNWIGKSIGALVTFKVKNSNEKFNIFTTRCDTLFGATYCVLSPEHELIEKITTEEQRNKVRKYQEETRLKTDIERTELNKDKTGVFVGSYAINPVNGDEIPIWISDYVLSSYGCGAIMAVPAHDQRDYEFAKKFNLKIKPVIKGGDITKEAYIGDGLHINSDFLNDLNKEDAIDKMIEWLEEKNIGKKQVNYHLRDWIFARQRYWGEPIPLIHMEDGSIVELDEKELPLVLPEMEDYKGRGGKAPLENATEWKNVTIEGKHGIRETSTMPGSAASSWYFLRYIDPKNNKELADKELIKHWMPVDLYVGGPEHAVGHLLYSRMWNIYLHEKGIVTVSEPFSKLVHQGMILGSNGIKMGKRFPKYCINPIDIADKYGADTLRLYEMFMGPLEADKAWSDNNVEAASKFIERVWRIYEGNKITNEKNKRLEKIYNKTIKKVTEDIENLKFNTAISQIMILVNAIYKEEKVPLEYAEGLIKLISPITPFMAEEVWEKYLHHNNSIAYESWPSYNIDLIQDEEITIGVQVNGKLRGTITISVDTEEEEMKTKALEDEKVKNYIGQKEVKKIIAIKGKIVNIVI